MKYWREIYDEEINMGNITFLCQGMFYFTEQVLSENDWNAYQCWIVDGKKDTLEEGETIRRMKIEWSRRPRKNFGQKAGFVQSGSDLVRFLCPGPYRTINSYYPFRPTKITNLSNSDDLPVRLKLY